MTADDLEAWLAAYGRAWEGRDPGAAAELFSEDVAYHETPFGPVARGREGVRHYWSAATGKQSAVSFSHRVVGLIGSTAIARWQAEYTRAPGGARVRLDGVFVLEFDDSGLCRDLREWWHRTEVAAERQDPIRRPSPG